MIKKFYLNIIANFCLSKNKVIRRELESINQVDWYNAHLSSWTPHELKECGYFEQFGEVGPKSVFGPGAAAKFKINNFLGMSLGILYPLFQRFPNFMYAFSALKRHRIDSNDYLRKPPNF